MKKLFLLIGGFLFFLACGNTEQPITYNDKPESVNENSNKFTVKGDLKDAIPFFIRKDTFRHNTLIDMQEYPSRLGKPGIRIYRIYNINT